MNREQILDAALRLVEAGGVAQLSMRKLAAELGVAPTTIYWHVGGKDAVLDALVERIVEDTEHRAPRGRTPKQRVASIARGIRAQVHEYPQLSELAYERGLSPAVSFPAQVTLARELTAAGFRGAQSARVMRSILFLVGGFVLLESRLTRDGVPPTARDLWRELDDPAGIDPSLVRELRSEPDMDEVFEYALTRLLDAEFDTAEFDTADFETADFETEG